MDLFGLILLFWPHRRGILRTFLGVLIVGWAAIFLLASSRYESRALFLPPSLKDDTMPLLQVGMDDELLGKSGVQKLLGSSSSPAIGVVESLDVRLAVVDRLKLTDRYGTESVQEAAEILESRTAVREEESGSITMSVQDSHPGLAREILVAYLEEIKKRSEVIIQEKVAHMVSFLEQRTQKTEDELRTALSEWQRYQERTQVFRVESTAESLSTILGGLIGTVAQAEAELQALRTSAGEKDALVLHQKTYIQELYKHIQRLQGLRDEGASSDTGPARAGDGNFEQLLPRSSELPGLAAAEQRFRLEVESKVKIAALLKAQFEMARLSLIRKEQHMVTLDPPVVPERPTARKSKLALINLFLAALAGLGYGAARLFWERFSARVLEAEPPTLTLPERSPAREQLETVLLPPPRPEESSSGEAAAPHTTQQDTEADIDEATPSESVSESKPTRRRSRRRRSRRDSSSTPSSSPTPHEQN